MCKKKGAGHHAIWGCGNRQKMVCDPKHVVTTVRHGATLRQRILRYAEVQPVQQFTVLLQVARRERRFALVRFEIFLALWGEKREFEIFIIIAIAQITKLCGMIL